MPDAKAPDCVIETQIVLTTWVINVPRSVPDGRHFQSNFYEWKDDCSTSDFFEVYSARFN